jgi:hypothetical protein
MNEIAATPQNLIIDKIQDVLRAYRFGCTLKKPDARSLYESRFCPYRN